MAIPNVSSLSKRINNGSEGGNEFARLMNYLLTAEANEKGLKIEPYSDASGDYKGLDAYTINDSQIMKGYQFKFYPSPLSSAHKLNIEKAVKSAMNKADENMQTLIIITPDDLMKEDKIWFDTIKNKYEHRETFSGGMYLLKTGIEHFGHTKIMELVLRNPHLGKPYFPELFPYDTGSFKLAATEVDHRNFIFDFSFTNDSSSTYLLNKTELIRLNVWSAITGIPDEHYLKSLGKLEFKVNMKKEVNILNFDDPLIFKTHDTLRFQIQLLNFVKTSPGNAVKIKFRFVFNSGDFFVESKPLMINL